jgi:hypothetical protein
MKAQRGRRRIAVSMRNVDAMIISRSFLLRIRNVSDKSCREKNAHFIFNIFSEYRAVYEIKWKNIIEPDRPQMTI